MTNLKTLKDIEEWCRLSESENHFGMYLRDAVQEWIKRIDDTTDEYGKLPSIPCCNEDKKVEDDVHKIRDEWWKTENGMLLKWLLNSEILKDSDRYGYILDGEVFNKYFFNLDDVECDK